MFVEFLGLPGVGKTSTLNKAKELRKSCKTFWIDRNEVNTISKLSDTEILNLINDYVSEDFINFVLRVISDCDMASVQKMVAIQYFKDVCKNYVKYLYMQKMRTFDDPMNGLTVVYDESFALRALSFIHNTHNFKKVAYQYFKMVPVPTIVFIFRAPINTIRQRYLDRGWVANCYGNSIDSDLDILMLRQMKILDIAKKQLLARGVFITEIDATVSLGSNAIKINEIIDSMQKNSLNHSKEDYMFGMIKSFLMRILPLPAKWANAQNQFLNEKIKLIEQNALENRGQLVILLERIDKLAKNLQLSEINNKKQTEQIIKNLSLDLISNMNAIENKINDDMKSLSGIITNIDKHVNRIENSTGRIKYIEESTDKIKYIEESTGRIRYIEESTDRIKYIEESTGRIKYIEENVSKNDKVLGQLCNTTNEILWADIFNSTTAESLWLRDKTLSPGRWAAGYPFLYILYRTLRDARPKRILELGLGETTKLISQYAAANVDAEHIVVEHDPEWISFFSQSFALPANTKIENLPWGFVSYKEAEDVRVYDGFAKRFKGNYDFICIDGPLGGDMKDFARIDVLNLIPEHLSDTFVILFDDYERSGEQKTVAELLQKLEDGNVPYAKSTYTGQKASMIICSEKMKFLTSL